jgi:hypothetical protein
MGITIGRLGGLIGRYYRSRGPLERDQFRRHQETGASKITPKKNSLSWKMYQESCDKYFHSNGTNSTNDNLLSDLLVESISTCFV